MNVRVHPPDGDVRLSVPPRASQRSIVRFVRECRPWIEQHRARLREQVAERPLAPGRHRPTGASGELLWHFGRPVRLEVVASDGRPGAALHPDGRLRVRTAEPEDRDAVLVVLERFRRRELRRGATAMLDPWAERLEVRYAFLGVRSMTTRWGTCVPERGRVWLNLALVERPPAALEYVVVHELAHLREASHGPAFQELMDRALPDWRRRRADLDRW